MTIRLLVLLIFAFHAPALEMDGVEAAGVIRGRPNIIWIYADDHAFQAISAYHQRFAKLAPTPNIDRLAREGAIFRHSYVANSICTPTPAM